MENGNISIHQIRKAHLSFNFSSGELIIKFNQTDWHILRQTYKDRNTDIHLSTYIAVLKQSILLYTIIFFSYIKQSNKYTIFWLLTKYISFAKLFYWRMSSLSMYCPLSNCWPMALFLLVQQVTWYWRNNVKASSRFSGLTDEDTENI